MVKVRLGARVLTFLVSMSRSMSCLFTTLSRSLLYLACREENRSKEEKRKTDKEGWCETNLDPSHSISFLTSPIGSVSNNCKIDKAKD